MKPRASFWAAFWQGLAGCLPLPAQPRRTISSPQQDTQALQADWQRIGNDFRRVIPKK